jgi:hypothetical protein
MALGRLVGSVYDGDEAIVPPSVVAGRGEFPVVDKGVVSDAFENRSGVVDRVRLLPICRSCRPSHSATRVRCRDAV